MKLLVGGFVASLLILFVVSTQTAQAQTPSENIWSGTATIAEIGDTTVQTMLNRPDCEFKNVKVVKPIVPFAVVFGNPIFINADYLDIGSSCFITNSQGSFAAQQYSGNNPTQRISYYSGSNNPSKMYSLANSNGSVFIDPAPNGNNVLMISGVFGANYKLTLMKDFVNESKLAAGGVNNVEWRVETTEDRLRAVTGSEFVLSKHAFSSNGRYLVIKYGNVVGKIDLQTMILTPVEWRSSWPTALEIGISNNGRNLTTLDSSGLYIYDSSNCETSFPYGTWENTNRNSYPGCVKSRNFRSELISNVPLGYDFVLRPHFELNSAGLIVGVGKRVVASNDLLPQRFTWKEFSIKADSYVSSTSGYIALGDSFSSGEGDLQGGTWYEPGTDEQGNIDTFEGRNLCHLSRRSYPYLIAKELGFLSGSADQPVTPPADGLFHSVACSGAKTHNIVGVIEGILFGEGDEDSFSYRDNQYRNDFLSTLGVWQPGRVRQLDFFIEEKSELSRNEQSPSVITLGIGGNDGGFGDTISACIMPGTCDQAVAGSPDASMLAAKIADVKPKLAEAYKAVKLENPEARIYVHGYPKFAQVDRSCALNVRLDAREVVMANEGVLYMNAVVQSAALESGVSYVDVSDGLINRNLCSLAPADQIAFNGVTAGNDISNIYLDIGTRGFCAIRTGCFGKETFHPNHLGQQLYKQVIMSQTNSLQTLMPGPVKQPYPVPSDFFGSPVQSAVISANISDGLISDTILIPIQKPLVSQGSTGGLTLNQSNLMPGSKAELFVYSEPILIDSYDVPINGTLATDFSLPEDLLPGVHEIHLKGTSKFGEQIDYYEQIIIGFSDTDFDGDGIANVADKCPALVNSNTDVDRDGIDDVCDSVAVPFVEPPPVEPPQLTPLQKLISFIKMIIYRLTLYFR